MQSYPLPSDSQSSCIPGLHIISPEFFGFFLLSSEITEGHILEDLEYLKGIKPYNIHLCAIFPLDYTFVERRNPI